MWIIKTSTILSGCNTTTNGLTAQLKAPYKLQLNHFLAGVVFISLDIWMWETRSRSVLLCVNLSGLHLMARTWCEETWHQRAVSLAVVVVQRVGESFFLLSDKKGCYTVGSKTFGLCLYKFKYFRKNVTESDYIWWNRQYLEKCIMFFYLIWCCLALFGAALLSVTRLCIFCFSFSTTLLTTTLLTLIKSPTVICRPDA